MSKVAVIFWSGSGNTAAMAQAVAEGALLVEDEGLIVNETPDAVGLEACRKLGEVLAKA